MNKIPLSTPTMNGKEMDYIKKAFDTNWIAPLGPNVDEFEQTMSDYMGIKYAAALSSGTAAIHLAIKLAGVVDGDNVFCQDMTFSASCNPIKYERAVPVFIDSEYDSWNMDPLALKKAFEKYPGTKAVIVVHLYGTPAKIDEIKAICDDNGAVLIEDAAESLGSTFMEKQTGSFGKYGIISFNGNKIITTSGGGMLLSYDKASIEKARFWATQARDNARHYQHSELGFNYRMSNVCAGIGLGQMQNLDERIALKTAIYNKYKTKFALNPYIEMNPVMQGSVANHWLSCMVLSDSSPISAIDIMQAMEKLNIETRPIWKPMSMQPYYKDCDFITLNPSKPVGYDIFARGLCLPSDIKMTEAEQGFVIENILNLFK